MKKKKWHQVFFWMFWWLFIIVCTFTIGYFLTMSIFGITGRPPEPVAYVLFGIISIILFAVVWLFLSRIFFKKDENDTRRKPVKDAINAMNRIAHGDFSVFLDPDNFGPYDELVESVNKMAKDLGNMETLRQEFVSNVSHEIQSPLTSIGGYVSLLESDTLAPAQRKHYIDIIKAESNRLSKLSTNLLKLSSLDSGITPFQASKFRLDKQIQNIVILLEPQWSEKNISITAELDKTIISADEELLSQVWINLLHNAIKFTPESGTIHIVLAADSEKISCTITDSGIGIAPEDQVHIFERFYKADKSRDRSLGGNGLGLSLVKKIVELHDGSVTLLSEPLKGTTFTITL